MDCRCGRQHRAEEGGAWNGRPQIAQGIVSADPTFHLLHPCSPVHAHIPFISHRAFTCGITELLDVQLEAWEWLWALTDANLPQVSSNLEMQLGSMASLQAVSEEEWHEEVAHLSPRELVEATFQRLLPDSFLYALPVWKHKVSPWPHSLKRAAAALKLKANSSC